MPLCTHRSGPWVSACAPALYLAAAPSADAETIDSVTTDYAVKDCRHKAGRDVEDYGEWRCRVSAAWRG